MATDEAILIEESPALSEADWRRLHTMLIEAFAYMDGRIDPPSSMSRMSLGGVKRKAEDGCLLVARLDENIVGCLFLRSEPDHMMISKLAVAEAHRGTGIAKALFRRSFSVAEREGLVRIRLQTRVELSENHAMFERFGFEKIGETSHAGYDRATSITMERHL